MRGVILAAGKGTRMLPLTRHRPKPLVPVLDMPMIEHIIKGIVAAGVDELCVVVGYKAEMIREYLGDGERYGAQVVYCLQEDCGGTGDAVLRAEGFVGEQAFFLCWGDIMVAPENYPAVVSRFAEGDCEGVVGANWIEDPYEGAAVYERAGYLERIVEKPPKGTASTHYNNAGIFVLTPQIFDALRQIPFSPRGELEVPSALMAMVEAGRHLAIQGLAGYWNDVARPASVLKLQQIMLENLSSDGILIAENAAISADARLDAPVYIGPDAQVGAAHLGPNAVVGRGCRIADGCRLTETACFAGARCGAGAVAEYAILEENAQLPAGYELVGDEAAPACRHGR